MMLLWLIIKYNVFVGTKKNQMIWKPITDEVKLATADRNGVIYMDHDQYGTGLYF